MDIEEYLKNKRHRKSSSDDENKIKYLKNLISRILISIIIVIVTCIYIKYDSNNTLIVKKYLFEDTFKFTKINKWYQDNFGNILPDVNTNDTLVFSSDELKLKEYEKYNNGVKINVDKNTPISVFSGGIVVFIGEKDEYGNTVIIQGNDGIDYWYGGITNVAINLYDYIESDTLIGETLDNHLYLVLQKDGNYLNYEEIL